MQSKELSLERYSAPEGNPSVAEAEHIITEAIDNLPPELAGVLVELDQQATVESTPSPEEVASSFEELVLTTPEADIRRKPKPEKMTWTVDNTSAGTRRS